jgi:hypothetical protein
MSQYPYQPSPFIPGYYNPMPMGNDGSRRARSAGNWQMILAVLMCLFGVGIAVYAWTQPMEPLAQAIQKSGQQLPPLPAYPVAHVWQAALVFWGVLVVLFGLLLGILGVFVRQAKRGVMIASVVLQALPGMFLVVVFLRAILLSGGNVVEAIGTIIMLGLPFAVCITAFVKLVGAIRQPSFGMSPTQQQAYWIMMQQQQQPPYGYGYGAYPPAASQTNPPNSSNLPNSPMPPVLPGMPPMPQNPPSNYPPPNYPPSNYPPR